VRRSGAPLRLYTTFFVVWLAASGAILRGALNDGNGATVTAAWFFVAGTGVLVVALVERDAAARRTTRDLLRDREALIESIGLVTDPRLTQLPLYQLLDELLGRARAALRGDSAAVFLLDESGAMLELSATSGVPMPSDPVRVKLGEGVAGQVAATRRGVALDDAPADRWRTASLTAAPLVAEGQLVGVVQLGFNRRREFRSDDLRLLQVVADRAAVAIDAARLEREARRALLAAEGARGRLALLADAGEVLGGSFDGVESMLDALAVALVPKFFDVVAVHRIEGDRAPELLSSRVAAEMSIGDEGLASLAGIAAGTAGRAEPTLVWGDGVDGVDGELFRPARHAGLESVVVASVSIRQQTFATMLFGTAGRRGLRPGDAATLHDLVARVAVAIERVLLEAETQRSAVRAARHADRLERLAEGAFAINAALATSSLATVVAFQACRVLDADAADVKLGAIGRDGKHGTRRRGSETATAHLTDTDGSAIGSVSVARQGAPFNAEEQAILGSLAQMASVAAANARLYAAAQESEARVLALYDASPVGIVELDDRGAAVRWNRAAERLFGWIPFEAGLERRVDVPSGAMGIVGAALADATTSGDVSLGDVDVELFAVPMREATGVRGVVLAAVDVTERKQVAEQLQQAHRMEAMARMAGGIAHDFNNVLMVITGYADLLMRRDLEEEVRDDVDAMRAAAVRAAEFTRKLLTISRRQIVQPQIVDVGELLDSLDDVLAVMVGDDVKLTVGIDDPPTVFLDPAQLEQLVLNLAINARDAMPEGGALTIRAYGIDDGRRWSVLEVADTGQGMDAATLEVCFEPFFTTKDRTKGTGLGLSTVYSVVNQAGGELAVDSAVGEGTTFTIRLPEVVEVPSGSHADRGVLPAGALRIMVVDDEPDVRAIVRDLLELEGHDVVIASNGEEALSLAAEQPPDVLLTDVVMPGMRGPDLARRLAERHPSMRVVLMSSHVDDELAGTHDLAGATFLAKPFSGELLLEAIGAEPRPSG
jgi:signal transduction histidine kinase